MPRTSDLPRLSQLDPATVADATVRLVQEHVLRLVQFGLGDATAEVITSGASLRLTTALLVRYAQTGEDREARSASKAAALQRDRIQAVCEALYSQAGVPGTFGGGDLDVAESAKGEPTEPIGVALVGAWARAQLGAGQPLSTREVAVLASLSVRAIQQASLDGEIELHNGQVKAAEARRWLSGRGVTGL